jgi:hypothetical protein
MAAKLQIHAVGLVLIILGLLSWVVALGGAGETRQCCALLALYLACGPAAPPAGLHPAGAPMHLASSSR